MVKTCQWVKIMEGKRDQSELKYTFNKAGTQGVFETRKIIEIDWVMETESRNDEIND